MHLIPELKNPKPNSNSQSYNSGFGPSAAGNSFGPDKCNKRCLVRHVSKISGTKEKERKQKETSVFVSGTFSSFTRSLLGDLSLRSISSFCTHNTRTHTISI